MADYITQISIDIEQNGDISADEIAEILEMHNIAVIGASWKATWDKDEYYKGLPPMASD